MRRRILLVLALAAACAVWTTTLASGAGPSPGLSQSRAGLSSGDFRYLALPASRTTEVQVVSNETGNVLRQMRVKGIWGIPLVAYDGTAEGLFPNGRTLLLHMTAAAHFMVHRYGPFDRALSVEPPP